MGSVIIVAGLFIAVLACMQLAQSLLLTQVTDQTTRSTVGRLCGLYAESAIEETRAVIARRVNTPSDPLFDRVRRGAGSDPRPHVIDTVSLRLAELPRLSGMLGSETGKAYELIEPLTCQLSYATATSILMRADYDGIAAYKARVLWKLDRSIVREVEETQGFRVNHLVLPTPLGRYPLVISNPERVVRGVGPNTQGEYFVDTNEVVNVMTTRWVPKIHDQYRALLRKLDELRNVGGHEDAKAFFGQLEPYYRRLENDPDQNHTNHFQQIDLLKSKITPFPPLNPAQPYALICVTGAADLVNLNLQKQLRARAQLLETTMAQADECGRRVSEGYSRNDLSSQALADNIKLANLTLDALRVAEQMLSIVWYFQRCLKVFDRSTDAAAYDHLRSILALLDPWQMGSAFNAFATRALFRITEQAPAAPDRKTIQQQWDLLKERLGREPGFFGTVYVDNTAERLTLTGVVRGTLVIAVRGPVLIENLKPQDDRDFLTIVAYGGPADQVGVRGQVKASIVARGLGLAIDSGSQIQGTLVVDEIAPERLDVFAGAAARDPRLQDDTFKAPFFYVGFSPWSRSRTTLRKME